VACFTDRLVVIGQPYFREFDRLRNAKEFLGGTLPDLPLNIHQIVKLVCALIKGDQALAKGSIRVRFGVVALETARCLIEIWLRKIM
jgi:hypothetical protein